MAKSYTDEQLLWLQKQPQMTPSDLHESFCAEFPGALPRTGSALQRQWERLQHEALIAAPKVPVSPMPDISNRTTLFTDSFLCTSDWHCPSQDAVFLQNCIDLAQAARVKHAIANGDLFTHDQFTSHPSYGTGASHATETEAVRGTFDAHAAAFDCTVVTLGNHDYRLLVNYLNSAMSVDDWKLTFAAHENVHVLRYPHVFVNGSDGKNKWVIGHPNEYRKQQSKMALDIHLEFYPTRHVITAHTHHVGMVIHRNEAGEWWCVDQGMSAKHHTFGYIEHGFNAKRAHVQGATLVVDHEPEMLRPTSNWDRLHAKYSNLRAA